MGFDSPREYKNTWLSARYFCTYNTGGYAPRAPAAQAPAALKAAWLRPRTSYRSGLAFRQTGAGAYGLECTLGVAPPRQGPISGDGAGTSPPEYGITLMCPRLFGEYAPTKSYWADTFVVENFDRKYCNSLSVSKNRYSLGRGLPFCAKMSIFEKIYL